MKQALRSKRLLMSVGILALSIGVIVLGVAGVALAAGQMAARSGSVHTAQATPTLSSYGVTTPTCDAPGQPACPTPDPGWIPFTSTSPSALLAAMKQTWIFQIDLNDGGDHVQDLSHLGTPFLVRGLGSAGKTLPDYYVLPIMTATGFITDVGLFAVNDTHTALHFVATTSHNGHYPIVRQTANAAITALQRQRHMTLKASAKPYLVYLDMNIGDIETGQIVWNAGGGPTEPVWLLPGSDDNAYIFGNDGKIYAQSEIPLSA